MKFSVELIDEACGMVRYDTYKLEAENLEDAIKRLQKISEKAGPGFYFSYKTLKQI